MCIFKKMLFDPDDSRHPKRTTVANNSEGSGYYIAKDGDAAARIWVISYQ